ncbi:hypothetical protein BAQ48_00145 [Bacillus luti]|uniref:hypothetical protein n=1 Tax=Bacillus luti TaxID=2026191 RepID=UPI0008FE0536|nr:hypothetical protein [Bacillus luti]OJE52887.1 hypothetical protein BAQ48_00145 [Bacillus luti]
MKKTGILFLLIACLMLAACGNVEKTASESQEAKETQKSDKQDTAQETKETQQSDKQDAVQETKEAQKSDKQDAVQETKETQKSDKQDAVQETKETQQSDKQDAAQEVKGIQEENNEASGQPAQKEESSSEKQNIVLQNLQIDCNGYDKEFTLRAGDKIDKLLIESITNDTMVVKHDNGKTKPYQLRDGVSVKMNAGSYTITLTDVRDGHVTAYVLDTKCFQ